MKYNRTFTSLLTLMFYEPFQSVRTSETNKFPCLFWDNWNGDKCGTNKICHLRHLISGGLLCPRLSSLLQQSLMGLTCFDEGVLDATQTFSCLPLIWWYPSVSPKLPQSQAKGETHLGPDSQVGVFWTQSHQCGSITQSLTLHSDGSQRYAWLVISNAAPSSGLCI